MKKESSGAGKSKRIAGLIPFLILIAFLAFFQIKVLTSYQQDTGVTSQVIKQVKDIEKDTSGKDYEVIRPKEIEKAKAAVIFYPGGWVDPQAYESLMYELADRGLCCILLKSPGNLAFLRTDQADEVRDLYPQIKDWYVGGHSLGGAAAGFYLPGKEDRYKGVILLASYVTRDLSGSDLKLLSVYGSNDGVLNRGSYEKYKKNWPKDSKELVIEGGIHSYFGSYGIQKKDGVPEISNISQLRQTADAVEDFAAN